MGNIDLLEAYDKYLSSVNRIKEAKNSGHLEPGLV